MNNVSLFCNTNAVLNFRARKTRKNQTLPEWVVWQKILRRDKTGFRFLRQKVLKYFIVDFYCHELLLVIEIDGESHDLQMEYDENRTKFLTEYGIKIVRYTNTDVLQNIEGVYNDILFQIQKRKKELKISS